MQTPPCTYGGNRFSQQIFTRNTNFNLCNNRRDESSKWSSSGVQGIKQIDPSTAVATGHARLLAKNKRYICIYAFCMRVFSNCCPPGSRHTPLKLASYVPYILGSPANHLCLYLAHCTLVIRCSEIPTRSPMQKGKSTAPFLDGTNGVCLPVQIRNETYNLI